MITRLNDVLENRGENYILPFFWQHGEDEATLRLYMQKIHEANIGAVCLEARPHPDYAGPQWWHDVDIILDEAKKLGMKIWILDDSHFPTGFANGKMKDADPELCKQYIYYQVSNVVGPLPNITLNAASMATNPFHYMDLGTPEKRHFDTDRYLYTTAVRKDKKCIPIDLTPFIEDGILRWSVPEGQWQIFTIYFTQNKGGNPEYINMLDDKSVRVLIDAVYEPHWAHYKDEFGKTLMGFFSDEPAVGNTIGFNFDEKIGNPKMKLPWSRYMPALMEEALGADWMKAAPALWTDLLPQEITARVRTAYMDAATKLISRCFGGQLGDWCRAHGVEYIGHMVEDNDMHCRLGPTLGHYFRALDGQDMSGIDDIGAQVIPGAEVGESRTERGEFYHFALGKLGASLGHIDPKKHGRTMCEIFGAYGWNSGIHDQWYLVNHFLVRGVNYYVPHAFSPKAFPDPDCPPHYYAHGQNPQFGRFGDLMLYTNRMCHLLNGGKPCASAAVLYHAEAEWAGEAMKIQQPIRAMMEQQLSLDVLPADLFADPAHYNADIRNRLTVNGMEFKVLVIPYSQYLSASVARFIANSPDFPVLFVDALPESIADAADPIETASLMAALQCREVVTLRQLPVALRNLGFFEVQTEQNMPGLRTYLYRQEQPILMLFNEDPTNAFDGELWVAADGPVVAYDAMQNILRPVDWHKEGRGVRIRLRLSSFDATTLVFGDIGAQTQTPAPELRGKVENLSAGWTRSICEAPDYPNFTNATRVEVLDDYLKEDPTFSGFIAYEKQVTLPKVNQAVLEISEAYEAPEVFVNGQSVGRRLSAPYVFDLTPAVKQGENTIRIEVATTLAAKVLALCGDSSAGWSGFTSVTPSGVLGTVKLSYK